MFQHCKSHSQTPLLSLLINPVVQPPPPNVHTHTHTLTHLPQYSALQPILSLFFLSVLPFPLLFFIMNAPATTNHRFGKNTQRGQEPRIKGWRRMVVWGVYVFCFKCVYACVLLFDPCWRSLTSLMCIQLSCFLFFFHLFVFCLRSSFICPNLFTVCNPILVRFIRNYWKWCEIMKWGVL